jgi:monoamine oxidase
MTSLSVTVTVTTVDPNNFVITVVIDNSTKFTLKNVKILEDLLTYTNVYFSTLTVDSIPVSFTRQILVPILYSIDVLTPKTQVTLSYPIFVYPKVDQATTFTSKVTVSGYIECSKDQVVGSGQAVVTTLPAAATLGPRIAIVGAGLAGLTAAYRLSQCGYTSIIYEGSHRIGGRCYSGYFKDGEVYEHGGELIDTGHADIISLIMELGLTLDNLRGAELPKTQEYYQVIDYPDLDADTTAKPEYVKYTFNEASYDFFNRFNPETGLTIYQQIYNDANNTYPTNSPPSGPATPWPLTYGDPVRAKQLDSMSVRDYINQVTAFLRQDKNGVKTKLAQLLEVAYVIEYGAEPCEQSSLNLVYLLGFITLPPDVEAPNIPSDYFYLFGISDETYHTHGGNSRIVERLLESLQQSQVSIFTNSRLNRIVHRNDLNGKYQLTFVQGNQEITPAPFDYVISAIPFSTYVPSPYYHHWGIDISHSDFSDLKKYAIYHLAMSRNCKLNVQFKNRFWRHEGNNGGTYATSNPYLTTPCGGDSYPGPQADMLDPTNPVGLNRPPVACPAHNAVGQYEKKFQNTWEVSRAQPQHKGILVDYTGGRHAEMFQTAADILDPAARNKYIIKQTCRFLKQLNFLLPGSTSSKNFEFEYDEAGNIINVDSNNWKQSPWQRGAYSFWQPQQYIAGTGTIVNGTVEPPGSVVPFAGFEGVPEPYPVIGGPQNGNFMFAGEQTAYDNQGFLNGAVESGNRVSQYLLGLLGASC